MFHGQVFKRILLGVPNGRKRQRNQMEDRNAKGEMVCDHLQLLVPWNF